MCQPLLCAGCVVMVMDVYRDVRWIGGGDGDLKIMRHEVTVTRHAELQR